MEAALRKRESSLLYLCLLPRTNTRVPFSVSAVVNVSPAAASTWHFEGSSGRVKHDLAATFRRTSLSYHRLDA